MRDDTVTQLLQSRSKHSCVHAPHSIDEMSMHSIMPSACKLTCLSQTRVYVLLMQQMRSDAACANIVRCNAY